MAAEIQNIGKTNIFTLLKRNIVSSVNKHLGLDCCNSCSLVKRNKDLKRGDFILLLPAMKCKQTVDIPTTTCQCCCGTQSQKNEDTATVTVGCHACREKKPDPTCEYRQVSLQEWEHTHVQPIPVLSWTLSKGSLYLKLDRTRTAELLLRQVNQNQQNYGRRQLDRSDSKIILVNPILPKMTSSIQASLYQLRTLLLLDHIVALLQCSGHTVSVSSPMTSADKTIGGVVGEFALKLTFSHHWSAEQEKHWTKATDHSLRDSKYRCRRDTHSKGATEIEQCDTNIDLTEQCDTNIDVTEQCDTNIDVTEQCDTNIDVTEQCGTNIDVTEQCDTNIDVTEQCDTNIDVTEQCDTNIDVTEQCDTNIDVTEQCGTNIDVTEQCDTNIDVTEQCDTNIDVTEQCDTNIDVTEQCDTNIDVTEQCDTNIDVTEVIRDQNLPVGRQGYDSNLQTVRYTSQHISQIARLDFASSKLKKENGSKEVICLHLCAYESEFWQQQVDLGWRLASASSVSSLQKHLVYGPVKTVNSSPGTQELTTEDLFRLRRRQMSAAFVTKYGQSQGCEDTVTALTVAAVKFELLSIACRKPVKIDVEDREKAAHTVDSRGGVFIMYNCARLANIFRDFDRAVQQGVYPALPDIDSVDFSLLREEEEWCLLFNFVLPYPSVTGEVVGELCTDSPRLAIQTHTICQFLQDLTRSLSSYYSRIRVLLEPRTHLLPVIYARLYLLKTVQQVLHNSLTLLNITPLTQV